jgi:hypothetical protein
MSKKDAISLKQVTEEHLVRGTLLDLEHLETAKCGLSSLRDSET